MLNAVQNHHRHHTVFDTSAGSKASPHAYDLRCSQDVDNHPRYNLTGKMPLPVLPLEHTCPEDTRLSMRYLFLPLKLRILSHPVRQTVEHILRGQP